MHRWLLLLFSTWAVCGCSRHASNPPEIGVKRDFGVTVSDKKLSWSGTLPPLRSPSLPNQITVGSADWFDLSSTLMEAGEKLGGEGGHALLTMGHNLTRAFYQQSYSSTKMYGTVNPPGSPWAETAFSYAEPIMSKKMDGVITQVEAKVAAAADRTTVQTSDLGQSPLPEQVIQRVIDGLQEFKAALSTRRDGTGDAFIDKINDSIEKKYIVDLEGLKTSVQLGGSTPLSVLLERLQKNLSQFEEVGALDKERLLAELKLAIVISKKNQGVSDSGDALQFLVDLWLSRDTQKGYPKSLKGILGSLTDGQILALATFNQSQIVSVEEWAILKTRTDTSFMSDRQLLALYLQNNGVVLSDQDWQKLQGNQLLAFNGLLNAPEVSHFADVVAGELPSKDAGNERYSLISNWLGVSQRLSVPDSLKAVFSKLNNSEIAALGDHSAPVLVLRGHLELPVIRYKVLDGLDQFGAKPNVTLPSGQGVKNIKSLIETAIVSATRERVNHSMIPVAQSLTTQLKESLIPILEQQRKEVKDLVSAAYKDYGRYYLGRLVFGVSNLSLGDIKTEASDNKIILQSPLPLIEKSQVHFVFDRGRWMETPDANDSGASVIGLSLVNVADRLRSLAAYENIADDARGATALQYQSICKMLAMSGYRDFSLNLNESLSVPMTAGHINERLDIKNYDPARTIFAVPDQFRIKNDFRLDESSRKNPTVSVEGQMNLLQGFARMTKYFKPWNPNSFDVGLGALRIEEEPTLKAFDRDDYFLLSLGLGSVILKNISHKMLGVITDSGQYVDGTQTSDIDSVSAASAFITDYDRETHSQTITAKALALAIGAMAEFYDQLKDLERTNDSMLLAQISGNQLQSSRLDLQKLISGMIIFATTKLSHGDGGFDSSFDLKTMKPSGERLLSDQLLMEKGLIEAGHVFKSDFMISRAVDNFFFLNTHFWDENLGFYRDGQVEKVRLVDVARALGNSSDILQFLKGFVTQSSNVQVTEESIEQTERLQKLWRERFFSTDIVNLPGVQQLFQFSL